MRYLDAEEPPAVAVVEVIRQGDVGGLRRLLAEHPGLARVRLGDAGGTSRTLLHVVTDWPGHYPDGPATVRELVRAGADVDGRFAGPHTETPLMWAASTDDVPVLDALLDEGADVDAAGPRCRTRALSGSGTPRAGWSSAARPSRCGRRRRSG